MANRVARIFPARMLAALTVLVLAVSALLAPSIATAAPASPTPPQTVASVTAQLAALGKQGEALSEQLNLATADVAAKQQAAQLAQTTADQAAVNFRQARTLLAATFTAQYEGSSFSRTGALLTSSSQQDYTDKLATMNMVTAHTADVLHQVQVAKATADAAQTQASALLTQARTTQATLTAQKATLAADQRHYESVLATLNEQQRQAYAAAHSVPAQSVPATATPGSLPPAPTAAAQVAVTFARAQVGKSYVFAGTGPNSFDCSGLTMVAYAHAGISLPHNAAAQYAYGTHVAYSQLEPGDLIFLYHPITHVEIYVGGGLAVSAADEALGVVYANVSHDMGDYVGATRLT